MAEDETGVTIAALLASLPVVLFVFFTNFVLLYIFKFMKGDAISTGRFALVTLGVVVAGSPFVWLCQRFVRLRRLNRTRREHLSKHAHSYSMRDKTLVLKLLNEQDSVSLGEVMALTGLNKAKARLLLGELGAKRDTPQSAAEKTFKPIRNKAGKNPFDS